MKQNQIMKNDDATKKADKTDIMKINTKNQQVDVLITTYNDGKYIKDCIESILSQTYKKFRLIIVDDGSTDETASIVGSFNDNRLEYYRFGKNSGNISKIRNKALEFLKNNIFFITDSDCKVDKDWLKEGMKEFEKDPFLLAVEGILYYNKPGYKKTLSDRYIQNLTGGNWCMANMAFKTDIIKKIRFNEAYHRMEDRDIALQIMKEKTIPFNKNMKVYHQIKKNTVKWFLFGGTKNAQSKVRFYKYYDDQANIKNFIYEPKKLLKTFIPVLFLFNLNKVKSWNDFKIWMLLWPQAIIERIYVWKTAIKERILVL